MIFLRKYIVILGFCLMAVLLEVRLRSEAQESPSCATVQQALIDSGRIKPGVTLSLRLRQTVKRTFTSKLSNMLGNRHRGSGRPLSPATPPYMRVRVRRFNGLRWTSEQPRKTDGVKVGDRKRNGQGRAVGKTPGAVAASYRVSDKGDAHSSLA
jgi:hypothetical protein